MARPSVPSALIASLSALRVDSLSSSPGLPTMSGMPNRSAKISQSRTDMRLNSAHHATVRRIPACTCLRQRFVSARNHELPGRRSSGSPGYGLASLVSRGFDCKSNMNRRCGTQTSSAGTCMPFAAAVIHADSMYEQPKNGASARNSIAPSMSIDFVAASTSSAACWLPGRSSPARQVHATQTSSSRFSYWPRVWPSASTVDSYESNSCSGCPASAMRRIQLSRSGVSRCPDHESE